MNSRQLRRQRHTIKMAKRGLRKFGKSMGWLMMQESPLVKFLKDMESRDQKLNDALTEPFVYSNHADIDDGVTLIKKPNYYRPPSGSVYSNRYGN